LILNRLAMGSLIAFSRVGTRLSPTYPPFGFLAPALGGLFLFAGLAQAQPLETPPPPTAAPVLDAADANPAVFEAVSREVGAIFAKCKDAVVRIEGSDSYGQHSGTGFFIDPAGTIYTHYAVAGRSWNLTVEFARKRYPAECLLADPISGVAILRIQATGTPFLTIGHSQEVRVASPVVAIGYPMALPACPSFGLVAGLDQTFLGHYLTTTHIRANVPIQPGEQGAPLIDTGGKVVGILVCRLDWGASCLALPIHAAEKVRADYLRFGQARPGWIGVNVKPVGDDPNGEVQVAQLTEDTPAAKCGLKAGDILLRVGDTPIHSFGDVRDAAFYLTADEQVPITVRRGDRDITVKAMAADLPSDSLPIPHAPRDLFTGNAGRFLP
jgi:serine protease Do